MKLDVTRLGFAVDTPSGVRRLLGPLDLEIRAPEVLAVTGTAGTGKSLLLRLLSGRLGASAGGFVLDGETLPSSTALRRHAVFVPSEVPASLDDVPSNLFRRARRGFPRAASKPAIEGLGLAPSTLETRFSVLDPTTRWAVFLALAGGLGARLLVVDTPHGSAEGLAHARLAAWIRAQAGHGTGIVLASRSEDLMARAADRIVVLYDGEVQAEGTTLEVIPGACRALGREAGS